METETLKPIDKVSLREATSHQAVAKVNALRPESEYAREPSLHPKGEGNMNSRNLTDTAAHLGGVGATAR
jgi:hypothetical protein